LHQVIRRVADPVRAGLVGDVDFQGDLPGRLEDRYWHRDVHRAGVCRERLLRERIGQPFGLRQFDRSDVGGHRPRLYGDGEGGVCGRRARPVDMQPLGQVEVDSNGRHSARDIGARRARERDRDLPLRPVILGVEHPQGHLAGGTYPVVDLEMPINDETVPIEYKQARVGGTRVTRIVRNVISSVLSLDVPVQQPQMFDERAALVGEQRKGEVELGGRTSERRRRVVADHEGDDVCGLETLLDPLQLDQLRTTVRSPLRAADEHDEGPPSCACGVDINLAAGLVRQDDLREPLAHARANRVGDRSVRRELRWLSLHSRAPLDEAREANTVDVSLPHFDIRSKTRPNR
jgi:hypothetical protein